MSKLLSELLPELEVAPIEVTGLQLDSRLLSSGDLFIAVPGHASDGRSYIDQALAKGVAAIVYEAEGSTLPAAEKLVPVKNLNLQVGAIASRFYDEPSQQLSVIGVTGTNGKTSVTQFIAQALTEAGRSCGVVGTTGIGMSGDLEGVGLTTPDPLTLQASLAGFLSDGAQAVAIEASSHGLVQGRLNGCRIDVAVFTNITRDHLDYHESMAAYQEAKALLFEYESVRTMVINIDDAFGRTLARRFSEKGPITFSQRDDTADIYCVEVDFHGQGFSAEVVTPWGQVSLNSNLLGDFNLMNLLAAMAVLCREFDMRLDDAASILARVTNVRGRMDAIRTPDRPVVVIDYAHTPDALDKALQACRLHCDGQLWCVFGCGGDRDKGKRPVMGELASRLADQVVITDDNPRSEPSQTIAEDILAGSDSSSAVTVLLDRREAIHYALSGARGMDLVLIAGKGHETYQEINGDRTPFSDYEVVSEYFVGHQIGNLGPERECVIR